MTWEMNRFRVFCIGSVCCIFLGVSLGYVFLLFRYNIVSFGLLQSDFDILRLFSEVL